MRTIGIRELRQNASRYIRLVKAGETIEVTERGVPVARLTPPPNALAHRSRIEQMIEEGSLIPGTQDWESLEVLPFIPGERTLSDILQEMRDEDER